MNGTNYTGLYSLTYYNQTGIITIKNDKEFYGILRVVGSVSYAIQIDYSINFQIDIYCGPNSVIIIPPNNFTQT